MKKTFTLSIVLFALIFALNSFAADSDSTETKKMPNFTLKNLDGDAVEFNDLLEENEVIYLDFWATWCVPCKKEMPKLDEIYKKYNDEGLLIACVSNDPAKQEAEVKKYIKKKRYSFMVLLDQTQEVSQKLGVPPVLPYGILVDSAGNIVKTHMGYAEGDEVKLEEEIKELLKIEDKDE